MKILPLSISFGLMLSLVNPLFANGGSVGGLSQKDMQAVKQDAKQDDPTQKDVQVQTTGQEQAQKDDSAKQ